MTDTILDYNDFVEFTCEESHGCYSSNLSLSEVVKSAEKYIDKKEIPTNPFEISQDYWGHVIRNMWQYYRWGRLAILGDWKLFNECPYCKTKIKISYNPPNYSDFDFEEIYVGLCENCGWWETDESLKYNNEDEVGRSIHRRGILKEFNFYELETPLEQIRKYISQNPDKITSLTPMKLEKFVASVFKEFFSCEAINVGGPNDKGIDVILLNGDYNCAIQVKRRTNSLKSESVIGIREFIGAMILNSFPKGIFVTTAHKFSKQAVLASTEITKLSNIEFIELCDSNRLIDICKQVVKSEIPIWRKQASIKATILNNINDGFSKFTEYAMGHPDWRFK